MPLADIELLGPDTALTPDCGKTSASRQTYITGKAAEVAGRALRSRILRQTNFSDASEITRSEGVIIVREGASTQAIDLFDDVGRCLRICVEG